MRALLAFAALALGGVRAPAQAQTPASQTPQASAAKTDSVQASINAEVGRRRAAGDTLLPDPDKFVIGTHMVPRSSTVKGPFAVARGDLLVYGTVEGDVVALDGDILVYKGGRITGDAWAVAGSVIIQGGTIEGKKRSVAVAPPSLPSTQPREPLSTFQSVKLVLASFALLAIIGIGVMIFAEANLDGVVAALERGFGKAFWIGLAGQVALLPALLVLVVALAITVLGALLIPFAIVAYIIAAAGLVTLGLLAVARLTGGALASDRGTTSPRGVHLRALVIGLFTYLAVWMITALFAWNPIVGAVLRAIAIAITWVAATLGLGATLVSRAGTQRTGAGKASSTDEYAWQTPTPVTGVASASRRVKANAG